MAADASSVTPYDQTDAMSTTSYGSAGPYGPADGASVVPYGDTDRPVEAQVVARAVQKTFMGYRVVNGTLVEISIVRGMDDHRDVNLDNAKRDEVMNLATSAFASLKGRASTLTLRETGDAFSDNGQVEDSMEVDTDGCEADFQSKATMKQVASVATSLIFTSDERTIKGADSPVYAQPIAETIQAKRGYAYPSAPYAPTYSPQPASYNSYGHPMYGIPRKRSSIEDVLSGPAVGSPRSSFSQDSLELGPTTKARPGFNPPPPLSTSGDTEDSDLPRAMSLTGGPTSAKQVGDQDDAHSQDSSVVPSLVPTKPRERDDERSLSSGAAPGPTSAKRTPSRDGDERSDASRHSGAAPDAEPVKRNPLESGGATGEVHIDDDELSHFTGHVDLGDDAPVDFQSMSLAGLKEQVFTLVDPDNTGIEHLKGTEPQFNGIEKNPYYQEAARRAGEDPSNVQGILADLMNQ